VSCWRQRQGQSPTASERECRSRGWGQPGGEGWPAARKGAAPEGKDEPPGAAARKPVADEPRG
jgi:hypothetical protein